MRIFYAGLALTVAMSPATAALMPVAVLRSQVEAFAGRPALVDPRLLLPECTAPQLRWDAGGRSVAVRCPAPVWEIFVPVAGPALAAPAIAPAFAAAPALPIIRRGERVMVEAQGNGFVVGIEAVAEADSRDGRVALRVDSSGKRLLGIVGDDGRVQIHGLNGVVNGR